MSVIVVQSVRASLFRDEIKISAYSVSQLKTDYLLFSSAKGIDNNSSSYCNGHHSNVRCLVGSNTTNTSKEQVQAPSANQCPFRLNCTMASYYYCTTNIGAQLAQISVKVTVVNL